MNPFIDLWLSHARGEPQEKPSHPQGPPPHLAHSTWKFLCDSCGYVWNAEQTDPDRRDGHWVDPVRTCISCHRAVTGRRLEPT